LSIDAGFTAGLLRPIPALRSGFWLPVPRCLSGLWRSHQWLLGQFLQIRGGDDDVAGACFWEDGASSDCFTNFSLFLGSMQEFIARIHYYL
jgi:hypothetical protein